jgi:hypothetical protein
MCVLLVHLSYGVEHINMGDDSMTELQIEAIGELVFNISN